MESEILPGDDTDWETIIKKMMDLEQVQIEAGFLTNKRHPESDLTIPAIAAIQQYGNETNNIPARPFITDGAVISQNNIAKKMKQVFANYLMNNVGLAVFEPIARASREGIAQAIAMQRYRPLSPVTIKIRQDKGNYSNHILIDTAHMINAIETKITKSKPKK